MVIPGMQVVGYKCHIIDEAPRPAVQHHGLDLSEKDWI